MPSKIKLIAGFVCSVLLLTNSCLEEPLDSAPLIDTRPSSTNTVKPVAKTSNTITGTTTPTIVPAAEIATLTVSPTNTATPSDIFTYTYTITADYTPIPTPDHSTSALQGYIFVWGGSYGYLDPWKYQEDYGFVFSDSQEGDPSFQAGTLTFSQKSHQVAYVTNEDHATLWIADIDLKNTTRLWVDEDDWLTYFSEGSSGYITWGPNDHFLILSRESIAMVYQLQNGVAFRLSGACDRIAVSLNTNLLAVWCPAIDLQENTYLVLEQDGSTTLEDSLPEDNVLVKEWVFAPDSNQVLYSDENENVFIWDGDQNIKRDLEMIRLSVGGNARALKWSFDGTNIFGYGYLNGNYCPEASDGRKLPCWSIRDANTGEIIWWPQEANFSSQSDATLSQDNKWIMLAYYEDTIGISDIISIETGEVRSISGRLFDAVYWSK